MQYRRISADCHLDMIWLPPDLFTSEAPRALKEKMPYVADQPDGTKRWVDNEGADFGMAGGVGAPGCQTRHERRRAVLFLAHDADVAADVGPAVGGGQRGAIAVALPYLPRDRPRTAQVTRPDDRAADDL